MSAAAPVLAEHLAILGVGLIGGSLARALRQAGACTRITGYGRRPENLRLAVELGVIDDWSTDVATAVAAADLVVLATPLATTEGLLLDMKDALKADAILTDVGSAKGCVIEAARRALTAPQLQNLIPGHPIAGREKSGVEHSSADLFADHLVILTPLPESGDRGLQLIRNMWGLTGARLVEMDVSKHDSILAATSHLPHMLAYALVDCLAGMQESEAIFTYAAGGFADFTRIASSSPDMWHDICIANSTNLLAMLDRFSAHLADFREAIARQDSRYLKERFVRAKQARDDFISGHPGLRQGHD